MTLIISLKRGQPPFRASVRAAAALSATAAALLLFSACSTAKQTVTPVAPVVDRPVIDRAAVARPAVNRAAVARPAVNRSAVARPAVGQTPSRPASRPPPVPLQVAAAGGFASRADVRDFIGKMSAEHGFDSRQLSELFDRVQLRDDIIGRITRPAEKTKPWHEYRAIFLDQPRIDGGAEFWRRHRETLALAETEYGVPAQYIVAILGVETRYGRITGNDGVLEALSTLAFGYPRRSKFFTSELESYLLLTREERISPLSLKGSYAGAMGLAQFMPSSYRAYAVDFDGDGRRDLWQNPIDAIGSIANYLHRHRWARGEPVAVPADVSGGGYAAMRVDGLQPQHSVAALRQAGVTPRRPVDDGLDALLLELEGERGPQYWLGFNNFYVITRYNRSPLYAMAVFQLGNAIQQRYTGGQ